MKQKGTLLAIILIGLNSQACQIGQGYPTSVYLNEETLELRLSGHRKTIRGFAVQESNPFEMTYMLTQGKDWVAYRIPNDSTQPKTVCYSDAPCEPCR